LRPGRRKTTGLAEAEQQRRIDDAMTVAADGDLEAKAFRGTEGPSGDADARGAAAPGVGDQLHERGGR